MSDFHARHEGIFEPSTLARKRVLVVGCGSVGSVLAMLLARSGVTSFQLADMDQVTETGLCRTAFVTSDLGRPKVVALADHLRSVRAGIDVDARAVDLRAVDDADLVQWIESSDLLVAVTDHPPTQARLGALSYHRVPVVFPGVYARGTGGEVLWTAPDETACYACVLGAIRGANAPSRGRTDYGIATGQLAAEPALGIDVQHVTVCAAKIALALLLRGSGSTVEQILDPKRSVLFVGNVVDWIWREPFETVWGIAERVPDCACRLPPGASTADLDLETGVGP